MNRRTRYLKWWQQSRLSAYGALTLTVLMLVISVPGCADTGGTQATATSTPSVPTATPIGGTIPQTVAILGGSAFAFNTKFGDNNCCFENGWTYQGPYGQMWTGIVTGDTGSDFDVTSPHRVYGIENAAPMMYPLNLTVTQAKAICGSFIPPDAKYHKTTSISDDTNSVVGFEQYYTSVRLARSHLINPAGAR